MSEVPSLVPVEETERKTGDGEMFLGVNEYAILTSENPTVRSGNFADCIFLVIRDENLGTGIAIHLAGSNIEMGQTADLLAGAVSVLGSSNSEGLRLRMAGSSSFMQERQEEVADYFGSLSLDADRIGEIEVLDEGCVDLVKYDFMRDTFYKEDMNVDQRRDLLSEVFFDTRQIRNEENYCLKPAWRSTKGLAFEDVSDREMVE